MEWLLFLIPLVLGGSLVIFVLRLPQGRINRRRNGGGDSTSSGDAGAFPAASGRHGADGDSGSGFDGGGDGGGGGGD